MHINIFLILTLTYLIMLFFQILKWLQIGATRVNLSNLWLGSWDYDNFIKKKLWSIPKQPNFEGKNYNKKKH